MPSYNRFIILLIVLFVTSGCSQTQSTLLNSTKYKAFEYKTYALEDRDILFALELERRGQKANAKDFYKRLYTRTNKEEYLLEYTKLSFNLKEFDNVLKIIEENKTKLGTKENEILRIYIITLVQKKDFSKALLEAQTLSSKYENDLNYELLGNIYLSNKKYEEAKDTFEKVYESTHGETSVLNLSNILYVYLDEKKEATKLLENHIEEYGCNNSVCSKLLAIYQEEKNIEGIIFLLKKTYYKFEDEDNKFSLEKVYKLLMYYLERKDINEAIAFLEESSADNQKLLELYRMKEEYKKAYTLAKELYDKTRNIDYLGQVAILEFESAKDKNKVIKSVISKFEEVLTVVDNHVYQNYLGYLLIDYNIDVKKGLVYVNKALEKSPNNLAYIDSLAWGQYKLKQCKSAYENMKKVVDVAGLKDKEIIIHWYKIKECSK